MDTLLYLVARTLIFCIALLPLRLVVVLGRGAGTLAWWLDKRHRKVALANLEECFRAEKSPAEIRALAKENFKRIGECYVGALKTSQMSDAAIRKILTLKGVENIDPEVLKKHGNVVFASGHFGNFELQARARAYLDGYRLLATYRGLKQASLTKIMVQLRAKSGALMFERRSEGEALKEAVREGGKMLGLLADQHAGDRAPRLPFLGRECSTSTAPAIFARRYDCALHMAICFRTGLGRWCIEIGPAIPLQLDGVDRSVDDVSLDVNRALETAILRDPANWFWVHRKWKPASKIQKNRAPESESRTDP
ncbi:MAG: lysophospholipid acyltransferase family protein [Verrucomicrobiia bacterium]|jgi:KDO2-lipid IV(A) lauroyltransferase